MNDDIRVLASCDFPVNLHNISKPPGSLYIRGELAPPHYKYLCVIGSRKPNQYGRDCLEKIMHGLRGAPISIVSGLAIGIDGLTHEIALQAGLHCVAFPGSSLEWNQIHPYSNRPLARKIVSRGGALLSQFGADFVYADWAFPMRNRLMAAISDAVLLIQAREKSGSLMTVEYATEFGRDVLAVPGSILSDLSHGPNILLRDMATPATSGSDVLDVLGLTLPTGPGARSFFLQSLDPQSRQIVEVLRVGPASLDDIVLSTNQKAVDVTRLLTTLEIAGVIALRDGIIKLI